METLALRQALLVPSTSSRLDARKAAVCLDAVDASVLLCDKRSIKGCPYRASPWGAGASAGALPDNVTLDEAKAYAGDAWTDDAQKAFDASASNGTTTKEAIAAYEQEQQRAATKLQASIRGHAPDAGRTRRSRRRRPSPTWARSSSSHR